jgi:hypothetical protein
METTNYDVNTQLALATTAEHEGDVLSALHFIAEAHRLSRKADRITRTRVFVQSLRLRFRLPRLAFA